VRVAFDTNILIYMESRSGEPRGEIARDLLGRIPDTSIILPAQVLGEFVRVSVFKQGRPISEVRRRLLQWIDGYTVVATTPPIVTQAVDLIESRAIGLWDAIVVASAANAGCRILISEDMQTGFTWNGLTIVNPFAVPRDPLLLDALLTKDLD
jgi:predicted nucleic acid-binding protein